MKNIFLMAMALLVPSMVLAAEIIRERVGIAAETSQVNTRFLFRDGDEVIATHQLRGLLGSYEEVVSEEGNVPDGIVREYYVTGKVHMETSYKNNRPHGLEKQYYVTGELEAERPYQNGLLEGTAKSYYKNGNLKGVGTYSAHKLVNAEKYDQDGNIDPEPITDEIQEADVLMEMLRKGDLSDIHKVKSPLLSR